MQRQIPRAWAEVDGPGQGSLPDGPPTTKLRDSECSPFSETAPTPDRDRLECPAAVHRVRRARREHKRTGPAFRWPETWAIEFLCSASWPALLRRDSTSSVSMPVDP